MTFTWLVSIVFTLAIVGLIYYLLMWAAGELPEPFQKIARVLIVLFVVFYLLGLLTGNVALMSFPHLR